MWRCGVSVCVCVCIYFRSIEKGNFRKFHILADGLLINQVGQDDTGEYTCRAYQVNSIASDIQERTILMKIEREFDLLLLKFTPK